MPSDVHTTPTLPSLQERAGGWARAGGQGRAHTPTHPLRRHHPLEQRDRCNRWLVLHFERQLFGLPELAIKQHTRV